MGQSIQDIRAGGTDLIVSSNPLPEPLNAPSYLYQRLGRFDPNIYNLGPDSHLFRFLLALAGDAGAGSIKRRFLYSRLQSNLESTHFTDLDRLFGSATRFPRNLPEIYSYDPRGQMLTTGQWQEVHSKDAQYRARSLLWMRALQAGNTPEGLRLAASAALGIECSIFEQYRAFDNPGVFPNLGKTGTRGEFVIIPQAPSIDAASQRTFDTLIDALKPSNSIGTLYLATNPRLQQMPLAVAASSYYFTVQKFITGDPAINWPAVDSTKGYWIQGGVEQEAPTFAFMDPQEDAFFANIINIVASTFHTGPFNKQQQQLFANLADISLPPISYIASKAAAALVTPIQTANQWLTSYGSDPKQTIINSHYPIDYLTLTTTTNTTPNPASFFWASEENLAPVVENLIVDIGSTQQINYINFEITQKPIDIQVFYSIDNVTYSAVTPSNLNSYSIAYLPSDINPWQQFEASFNTIQARYFKIIFTRRTNAFPLATSTPFPWSVDVRNLRVGLVAFNIEDLLTDQNGNFLGNNGIDFIGNKYRTQILPFPPNNVLSTSNLYWKSQPNPSPFAVESLYFDLRLASSTQQGTQSYLDNSNQVILDTRQQSEIETYHTQGQVINQIYIDPINSGLSMHIYYSDDDTPTWDDKLWTPINRHYIVQRGYCYLPTPILTKYVKLEFTQLAPEPYDPFEYPISSLITYNKYPSWVQLLFNNLFPITLSRDNLLYPFDNISIDPISFGFKSAADKISTGQKLEPLTFIDDGITSALAAPTSSTPSAQEADITFNSAFMYQEDLVAQLNSTRALSRFVKINHTTLDPSETIATENGVPPSPAPDAQSVAFLDPSEREKKLPDLYFPITCRHGYQVLEAPRPAKIAYFAGIRNISFWRKDYTVQFDDPYYLETFDDAQNILQNDFVTNGLFFQVGAVSNFIQITSQVVTLNSSLNEDFDEINGSIGT